MGIPNVGVIPVLWGGREREGENMNAFRWPSMCRQRTEGCVRDGHWATKVWGMGDMHLYMIFQNLAGGNNG